ncbi:BtrH N-terminal domain-containing protein [Pseudonocardia endophytica]|uniref:Uncharacterized protein DUF4872 n=1 Tax=Pseudonocardia endophytica TaxID=401976 RepID=A0A4R1HKY5_PSEEN|nr:BtrH N-terminal domain-containing protein [Pseudonocardia endophytica]TCK22608.1 uncharacterized protein DUF4872 [Pseudonocardia endophytica]
MTSRKQLKIRVRARMARTGESYSTALRHVAGPAPETSVGGYRLRGGVHPESASVANVLAHHGVRSGGAELTEALVFGAAGGPGAGYILWEFAHDDSRPVVIGFSSQWQYHDRALLSSLERLGVPARVHRTAGSVGAAGVLAESLADGAPAIVWPDRVGLGYRHLPASMDGMGGHPVVVHGTSGDACLVDDRTLARLSVPADELAAARARVGSYRNLLVAPAPAGDVPVPVLQAALRSGIADCAARLAGTSTSFALPAWRKWSRLMTDAKAAKGWPRVFDDGRGLVDALASIWEGASPAGMTGGHLRDLTADMLDQASPVIDTPLDRAAAAWREAAGAWRAVAETALPIEVPAFARLRELTAAVQESITAEGDAGRDDAARDAAQLWALRAGLSAEPPLGPSERTDLFAALAGALGRVHDAERAAVGELTGIEG